jgi:hypothetical protein
VFDGHLEERRDRQDTAMTSVFRWAIVGVSGIGALFYGVGLGVAGGAHLREMGRAFTSDALQFWLWAFLLLSLALAIPRATRRISWTPIGIHPLTLTVGYWAGYHWGNFIGWHPD